MQDKRAAALSQLRDAYSLLHEHGGHTFKIKHDKDPRKGSSWLRGKCDTDIQLSPHQAAEFLEAKHLTTVGHQPGPDIAIVDSDNPDATALVDQHFPDENTILRAKTPRGFHRYLLCAPGAIQQAGLQCARGDTKLGDGVDLKVDNGYVVGPGSELDGYAAYTARGKALPESGAPYLYAVDFINELAVPLNASELQPLAKARGNGAAHPNPFDLKIRSPERRNAMLRHIGDCLKEGMSEPEIIDSANHFALTCFHDPHDWLSRYARDFPRMIQWAKQSPAIPRAPRIHPVQQPLQPDIIAQINKTYGIEIGTGKIVHLDSAERLTTEDFHIAIGNHEHSHGWLQAGDSRQHIAQQRLMQPGAERIIHVPSIDKHQGKEILIPTLNLWQDFGVRPVNHGPELLADIFKLLNHLLAETHPDIQKRFKQHQFGPVLFPGAKLRWAIYMFGATEGVGKTMWSDIMLGIFGEHGLPWGDNNITARWNGQLEKALYIAITEPSDLNAQKNDANLKKYITDRELTLEDKHRRFFKARNYGNWSFFSNDPTGVNMNHKTRRYQGIHPPEREINDPRDPHFYQRLGDAVDEKLASEMLFYHLLNEHHLYYPLSPERCEQEANMVKQEANLNGNELTFAWQERLRGRLNRPPPASNLPWDGQPDSEPLLWNWNLGTRPLTGKANRIMIAHAETDLAAKIRELMANPYPALRDIYPDEFADRAENWIFYLPELHWLLLRDPNAPARLTAQKLRRRLFREQALSFQPGEHSRLFAWCLIPPHINMLDQAIPPQTRHDLMQAREWLSRAANKDAISSSDNNVVTASNFATGAQLNIISACNEAKEQGTFLDGPTDADLRGLAGILPNLAKAARKK